MSATGKDTSNNRIRLEWVPSAYRQAVDKSQPEKANDSSDNPLSYIKKSAHVRFSRSLKRKAGFGRKQA